MCFYQDNNEYKLKLIDEQVKIQLRRKSLGIFLFYEKTNCHLIFFQYLKNHSY